MGCYKLTYDYQPTLFLQEQRENFYTLKWAVGTNTGSKLLGEDAKNLTQSDPYVQKTQTFRLNAGSAVGFGDQDGRVATFSMATYSMDLTVSVFKAGVFDADGNLNFVWRAKVSAVSFVSAAAGDIITMGTVALTNDGNLLGEYSLGPASGPIIPPYTGQYSYVGERYIDLPNSYGNVQLQFSGTWVLDNYDQRQVPMSITQPVGFSVSQTVRLH